MNLGAAVATEVASDERAAAHAQPHRLTLKIQAKMVFKFSAHYKVILFTTRSAKGAIAFHLRPTVSGGPARNHADKQDEVTGRTGMETPPALPLRIWVEVS